MNMTSEQVLTPKPITIFRLQGDVDGSNYFDVIRQAQDLHAAGTRHMLLDLSGVTYMSSAGLVALNNIALLFSGGDAPNPDNGWGALHAITRSSEGGMQDYVKLLSPTPRVSKLLEQTGLVKFFQVFDDQAAALASF